MLSAKPTCVIQNIRADTGEEMGAEKMGRSIFTHNTIQNPEDNINDLHLAR